MPKQYSLLEENLGVNGTRKMSLQSTFFSVLEKIISFELQAELDITPDPNIAYVCDKTLVSNYFVFLRFRLSSSAMDAWILEYLIFFQGH